jgi:HPr kinase/phosphorylase
MTMVVHATCVALRPRGRSWRAVLLRGPSGAGKSDLALRLIEAGGRLVADDQTELVHRGNSVVASAPASIAGLIEARGVGILKLARDQVVARAPLALLVDLAPPERIERLPEPARERLLGVDLPVLMLAPFEASASAKLRLALMRIAVA